MSPRLVRTSALLVAGLIACSWIAERAAAAPGEYPTFTDKAAAGADYGLQGEYTGELATPEGNVKFGAQVIALGDGKFDAVAYPGGLPGDGWVKEQGKQQYSGELKDGAVVFPGDDATGALKDGVITVKLSSGEELGQLKKVERASPTLGAAPPDGAIVLFDGGSAEAFDGGKMTEDNLLAPGCATKQEFRDFTLHLEFCTPFMPTARGQARGNSGVYLQDRYEVQVLDSFGLEGKNNECGGIYAVQDPALNMCYPPLVWQTYDVDFQAARFDDAGNKVKNAVVTVKHNGVPVYNEFELPAITPGGASNEAPGVGPLKLQDHGNPVRFRNVWIVEKP